MIRRPPRSTRTDTLFPYTTLFRSGESEFCARVRRALAVELGGGTYRSWIDPCAVVIHDGWLSIIAATRVHGEHIRSEEHTSELQSLMRISYAVFCLKKKKIQKNDAQQTYYKNNNKRSHILKI